MMNVISTETGSWGLKMKMDTKITEKICLDNSGEGQQTSGVQI
jgi:hypothetical protein